MERMRSLHKFLVDWGRDNGFNQREIAEKLGVRESSFSKQMTGTYGIKPQVIQEIARLTGKPADEILAMALEKPAPVLPHLPVAPRDARQALAEAVAAARAELEPQGYEVIVEVRQKL